MKTISGLAVAAAAVGIAAGVSDASATPAGYLSTLKANGIYASTPGAASCVVYPGDRGCTKRFTTAEDAVRTGYGVCRQLHEGRSPSSIANSLYIADGLFLSKKNAAIVVNAAQKELCS